MSISTWFFTLTFFWGDFGLPKGVEEIPRSLGLLHQLILLVLIVSSRSTARLWLTGKLSSNRRNPVKKILIYGAGSAGVKAGYLISQSDNYLLIGYIDDDTNLRHRTINGVVVYGFDELEKIIKKYGVTNILLAIVSFLIEITAILGISFMLFLIDPKGASYVIIFMLISLLVFYKLIKKKLYNWGKSRKIYQIEKNKN